MLQSEFDVLSVGAKVLFLGTDFDDNGAFPPVGTVLTRKETWMDDSNSSGFEWNLDGDVDYHFFAPNEVELVKE